LLTDLIPFGKEDHLVRRIILKGGSLKQPWAVFGVEETFLTNPSGELPPQKIEVIFEYTLIQHES